MFPAIARATVLLTVSLLLVSCTADARKERRLRSADRYLAEGAYEKAEIEYANVLVADPLNAHAIGKLGIIYFDQARLGRVFPFLDKARELSPENIEVRKRLAQLYAVTGTFDAAQKEARYVLEKAPADPEAPPLLADSVVKPADIEEARATILRLGETQKANAGVPLALGLLELKQQRPEAAEQQFEASIALSPKFAAAHLALANLHWAKGDLTKAAAAFSAACAASPTRSSRHLQFAKFHLRNDNPAAARKLLEDITAKAPDYLAAWVLLAEIAAAENDYPGSLKLARKVLTRDPDHAEALYLSARARLVTGDKPKALLELERAAKLYPQSPQIQQQLAAVYASNGEINKAVAAVNQALALSPKFIDAVMLSAELHVRQGNLNAAAAALKTLAGDHPALMPPRLLLGQVLRLQGRIDEALAIYRQLNAQFPQTAHLKFLEGSMLQLQNKRADARRAFEQALEWSPDHLPALEQLVQLDVAERNFAGARTRVEASMIKNANSGKLHLLLAQIYLAEKNPAGARPWLEKAITLQPDQPTPYLLLARLYLDGNEHERAFAQLTEAAAKNAKSVEPRMMMAVLHEQRGNFPAARENYEHVLALNPRFTVALNNLAYLLSERFGEADKALELAQKAREIRPNDPNIGDTLGWILYKKRQYTWALSLLSESAEKLPDAPEIQLHLGMTHYMLGDETAALTALKRTLKSDAKFEGRDLAQRALALLEMSPATVTAPQRAALEEAAKDRSDAVALARLGDVLVRENKAPQAVAAYEQALAASPTYTHPALALIGLYSAQGQDAKALELAKAARKRSPTDPDVAYATGRLACLTGDITWGMSLLQEAVQKRPDAPEILFDYAHALYALGLVDQAQTAMRKVSQAHVLSLAGDARRFLQAIEWAAKPAAAAAALADLEPAVQKEPVDLASLMALGAAREHRGETKEAIAAYERALGRFADFTPAKRRLAILYASIPGSDRQRTYELASRAREAFPNDPEVAKAFGIATYHQGNYSRALNLLQEGARTRDKDAELVYYLGMAQRGLKQIPQSRASLQRALALQLPSHYVTAAEKALADPAQ